MGIQAKPLRIWKEKKNQDWNQKRMEYLRYLRKLRKEAEPRILYQFKLIFKCEGHRQTAMKHARTQEVMFTWDLLLKNELQITKKWSEKFFIKINSKILNIFPVELMTSDGHTGIYCESKSVLLYTRVREAGSGGRKDYLLISILFILENQ